ncbi:protein-L-isoaspartate(D-aspartate) O-methyltransferase [Patescibacteria group bacterium]
MDKRQEMVDVIENKYGLDAPRVFSAMLCVPREKFVAKRLANIAYEDQPIPIGYGQTISQPYTVAFMTHLLDLTGNEKVLEIGTGSGYQAAVLSNLVNKVYTIEIIDKLAVGAQEKLKRLGFSNVKVKHGKGEKGWKRHSLYDAIIVTAGVKKEIPPKLFEQLKVGGILVAPMGMGSDKKMTKIIKISDTKMKKKKYGKFQFVPFVEG